MELAWETLDDKIKEKIRNKKAVHSSLGASFFVNDYKQMKGNGNIDEYSSIHPIIRTHPETQKKDIICQLDLHQKNSCHGKERK